MAAKSLGLNSQRTPAAMKGEPQIEATVACGKPLVANQAKLEEAATDTESAIGTLAVGLRHTVVGPARPRDLTDHKVVGTGSANLNSVDTALSRVAAISRTRIIIITILRPALHALPRLAEVTVGARIAVITWNICRQLVLAGPVLANIGGAGIAVVVTGVRVVNEVAALNTHRVAQVSGTRIVVIADLLGTGADALEAMVVDRTGTAVVTRC